MPVQRLARQVHQLTDDLKVAGLCGLLYFALAVATIALTNAFTGVAAVWPANAVALALLLRRQPSAWWPILLAVGIGNIAANLATRGTLAAPILFSMANVAEVAIAAAGLRLRLRKGPVEGRLKPSSIWRFLFWAGLVAPVASGVVGATAAHLQFGQPLLASFCTWVMADALGLLVVTPFMLTLFDGTYLRRWRESNWRQRGDAAAFYGLTALVTAAVFSSNQLPLLFLVSLPLMLVTFRFGWPGTNVAVMIVAWVGAVGTINQVGPVTIPTGDPVLQAVLFQFFLASLLVTCMPVAAAVASSRDLMRELQESERSLRLVVSQSPSLLVEFNRDGLCHKAFGAREILAGVGAAELVGQGFEAIAAQDHEALRVAHGKALAANEEMFSVEFQPAAQAEAWYEATFTALVDERGRCIGSIASIHEVTERKLQARALARSAMFDSLTGLLNRAGFLRRLDRALAGRDQEPLALALIDVDRFKLINDNCGHPVGDAVLVEIARRIAGEVGPGDAVGRLGGDEFAVMIDMTEGADAQDVCARIVAAVARAPVMLASSGAISVAISCGLARKPASGLVEDFMLAADNAPYEAKRGGRNRVVAAA